MQTTETFLIGAISKNGIYGFGRKSHGQIPWKSTIDMGFFRDQTTGNEVAMSSGMWEALPEKYCPLSNRGNIIITRQADYPLEEKYRDAGVCIAKSAEEAKEIAKGKKLYFAGGPDLWYGAVHSVDVLLINVIGIDVEEPPGVEVVKFPHLMDPTKLWSEFIIDDRHTEKEKKNDGTTFPIEFRRYIRQ